MQPTFGPKEPSSINCYEVPPHGCYVKNLFLECHHSVKMSLDDSYITIIFILGK